MSPDDRDVYLKYLPISTLTLEDTELLKAPADDRCYNIT
jgi:hypothetical protein